MIIYICLYWIGLQLSAPAWYYGILIFGLFIKILDYGIKMYKRGKEDKQSDK